MLLDRKHYRDLSRDIAFTEQKIRDYLSPEGTFPEQMYLAEELKAAPCRMPDGYTQQDVSNLLMAITSSDECLNTQKFTSSTYLSVVEDPKQDRRLIQLSMITSNSFAMDDFARQPGASEAFLNARRKYNEVTEQIGQGDLSEARRLVSSGIKNQLLLQKRFNRTIQTKKDDYAAYRSLEMAIAVLEKNPELRDPKILSDQDMEDIQIARGMAAYYRDFHEKSGKYIEKYERGEELSEDEVAELIFLNQVQGVSVQHVQKQETYLQEEGLKELRIPGGIPMPIGQTYGDLSAAVYSMDIEDGSQTFPLENYLGKGQHQKFKIDSDRKIYGLMTQEGYDNFARAILYGYPQSKEKFLNRIKGTEFFRQVMEQQKAITLEYPRMAAAEKSSLEAKDRMEEASQRLNRARAAENALKREKKEAKGQLRPEKEQALVETVNAVKRAEEELKSIQAKYREKNNNYTKQKENLAEKIAIIEGTKDRNIFTESDIDELLQEAGLAKKSLNYKGSTIPENEAYAEALEAKRQGVDLLENKEWHARIKAQRTQIEKKARELEKSNGKSRLFSTWSYGLRNDLESTKETWIRDAFVSGSVDPLMDLLKAYPGQAFTLDEHGNREVLNIGGTDPEEIRNHCLEAAQNNGLYIMAPENATTENPVWCIRLNEDESGTLQTMEEHLQYLEQEESQKREQLQQLQKPSAWKRFWAFLVPGYREEIREYKEQLAELNRVSTAKGAITGFGQKEKTRRETERELTFDQESPDVAESYVELKELKNRKKQYQVQAYILKPGTIATLLQQLIRGGNSTEKISPELAMLALIDSVGSPENGNELKESVEHLDNLLSGNQEEKAACVQPLQDSYRKLQERIAENKQPLLSGNKLRCFYEALLQPGMSIPSYQRGAALLNGLGEENLLAAIGSEKPFPSEVRGLMRYSEIAREAMEICAGETDRAMQNAQAVPSKEDVVTVLLMDTLEKDHMLGTSLKRNPKNHLLYTPLLRSLGKTDTKEFRKEIADTLGEDFLNRQAELGSEEFVLTHKEVTVDLLRNQKPEKNLQNPASKVQRELQKPAGPQK